MAKQRLAGNSEPVSLEREISHGLEARYLYTEVGAEDSKHLGIIQELKRFTKASSESASPYSSIASHVLSTEVYKEVR